MINLAINIQAVRQLLYSLFNATVINLDLSELTSPLTQQVKYNLKQPVKAKPAIQRVIRNPNDIVFCLKMSNKT